MKVILLQDVKALGKADDIVEVSAGYANNMLFKKNLALEATPSNLNSIKIKKKAEQARADKQLQDAKATAKEMEDKVFSVPMKCGEGKRLYGAVTAMDIASALLAQGYKIDKRGITVDAHMKTLGDYEVDIKLHTNVSAKIKVRVVELAK